MTERAWQPRLVAPLHRDPASVDRDEEATAREAFRDAVFRMLTDARAPHARPPLCHAAEALRAWLVEPVELLWLHHDRRDGALLRARGAATVDLDDDAAPLMALDAAVAGLPTAGAPASPTWRSTYAPDDARWRLVLSRRAAGDVAERLVVHLSPAPADDAAALRRHRLTLWQQGLVELVSGLHALAPWPTPAAAVAELRAADTPDALALALDRARDAALGARLRGEPGAADLDALTRAAAGALARGDALPPRRSSRVTEAARAFASVLPGSPGAPPWVEAVFSPGRGGLASSLLRGRGARPTPAWRLAATTAAVAACAPERGAAARSAAWTWWRQHVAPALAEPDDAALDDPRLLVAPLLRAAADPAVDVAAALRTAVHVAAARALGDAPPPAWGWAPAGAATATPAARRAWLVGELLLDAAAPDAGGTFGDRLAAGAGVAPADLRRAAALQRLAPFGAHADEPAGVRALLHRARTSARPVDAAHDPVGALLALADAACPSVWHSGGPWRLSRDGAALRVQASPVDAVITWLGACARLGDVHAAPGALPALELSVSTPRPLLMPAAQALAADLPALAAWLADQPAPRRLRRDGASFEVVTLRALRLPPGALPLR